MKCKNQNFVMQYDQQCVNWRYMEKYWNNKIKTFLILLENFVEFDKSTQLLVLALIFEMYLESTRGHTQTNGATQDRSFRDMLI